MPLLGSEEDLVSVYMIDSIAQNGLAGVQRGLESASHNADAVIKAYQNGDDPIGPAVDLQNDVRQVQASTKIIQVADKLNGAILDIFA